MHDIRRFNSKCGRNLSKESKVKARRFPGATVEDFQHRILPIIQKKLIIHADTYDVVRPTSSKILGKRLQLKKEIKDKIPVVEVIL